MRLLAPAPLLLLLPACGPDVEADQPNQPPSATEVSIGPVNPGTNDNLVVITDVASEDPEGAPVTYTYAWTQNGSARADLSSHTVPAEETTKGDIWEVTVTPNDGDLDGEAARNSTIVVNTLPVVAVEVTPASPSSEEDVVAVATATDSDGDPLTLSYLWALEGAADAYVSDTLPADATTRGDLWSVTVTPADDEAAGEPVRVVVEIGSTSPVMLGVTLSPEAPYADEDVVAHAEASDADGDVVFFDYTWSVDGTEVQWGASDTLAAGNFVKHQRISVEVTPNDGFVIGTSMVSADALAVNSPPVAGGADLSPTDATELSVLTCSGLGFADVDLDPESWTFGWTVDGADIGVAASTLDGASFSRGSVVACSATPFDGEEAGLGVWSNAVTIANSAPTLLLLTLAPDPAYEGDTLACAAGATADDDGDAVGLTYAWTVSGSPMGYNSATLEDSYFDRGDTVTCSATPTDGTDAGVTLTSNAVSIQNSAPSIATVSISPASPTVESTLTCAYTGYDDADGDADQSTYEWTVAGTVVGTASTLSGAFVRDDLVTCTVTPGDGADLGTPLSDSVTITNSAPVLASVAISPSAAYNSDVVTCLASATDPDGGSPTLSYAWTNTTQGTTIGSSSTLALTSALAASSDTIACTVTAADADGGSDSDSTSLTLGNRAPVVTASLSPSGATRSSTVTCTGSAVDADADTSTLSFVWTVDGVTTAASYASGSSSSLAGAFVAGDVVACAVTATDGKGGTGVANPSLTIANAPPVVSSVTLSPSAFYTNDTLSATAVSSDPDGDSLSLTYAWYVDGVLVRRGASSSLAGSTYFDRGEVVYVTAVASDGSTTGSATSSSVTVLNTPPTAPVVDISPESPSAGDDITCSVTTASTDADGDGIRYSFEWAVDGLSYTSAADSALASVVDGGDVVEGQSWDCEVVASDGTDESSAAFATVATDAVCISSATFTVVATARSELETINAATADIDGDGWDDVMFPNQLNESVTIWWGGSSFPAAETTVSMGRVGYGVDAGDINGDGYPDLIASNQDYSRFMIAMGTGARTFGSASALSQSGFPQGVSLVDSDRDGDLDLISTLGHSGCTTRRLNNGSGTFASGSCFVSNTNQKRPIDVDGDGYDELVESGTGTIYSSASGSWVSIGSVSLGSISSGNAIYPYDVDGDGAMDLAVADGVDMSLTTLTNDGAGNFSSCDTTGATSYWPHDVADFDLDGDLDYVTVSTCSYCSSTWRISYMD